MASTNKTTHYDLPQFVGTDKPTWLGDVNGAMSAIDAAIYEALTTGQNANSLATSANAMAGSAASAASNAVQTANSASTSIGSLSSLETDAKNSVVAAINDLTKRLKFYSVDGTNCTCYIYPLVGVAVRVIATSQTLTAGNVNTNIVATLPDAVSFYASLLLPVNVMNSNYVPNGVAASLSFSNSTKNLVCRISGSNQIDNAVINGFYFFPWSVCGASLSQ